MLALVEQVSRSEALYPQPLLVPQPTPFDEKLGTAEQAHLFVQCVEAQLVMGWVEEPHVDRSLGLFDTRLGHGLEGGAMACWDWEASLRRRGRFLAALA